MNELKKINLELTKKDIVKATTRDNLIIQTIHSIDEITRCINKLATALKERYILYSPSILKIKDLEEFLKKIPKLKKEDMGIKLTKEDLSSMQEIYLEIINIKKIKKSQEKYLKKLMQEICPFLNEVATEIIGAKLIEKAGSLRKLAMMPSSTIQVLGAEKALFRHIKTKTKPPKFGVIFSHKSITTSKDKGKAARQLAAKISIAVKKDFFR